MNAIRLTANPQSDSQYLSINLNNTFDNIEILSLSLTSSDFYKLDRANYGVLVGRVSTNGGFGIQNAKVSIFIPISESDKLDAQISALYPYSTLLDKKSNGLRYNLLPKDKQFSCHNPTGDFSSKNEVLDNNLILEVYEKYYKFTTTTNHAGDYMIIGVPVGVQQIHMDVDLSDIGFVSVRPYDLVNQGYSPKQFVNLNKFKSSNDLDSLPQIQKVDTSVLIKPFWGDNTENEIGLTLLNFNLPINITPNALFFGGLFTDSSAGKITKNCRPRIKTGRNCDLTPSFGDIEMVRLASEFSNEIEYVPINGEIDEDGTWNILVPMNLEKMVTDEFGNLVLSNNPNVGIPTKSNVRFRVNSQYFSYRFFSGAARTGSFLVPNMHNRFQFGSNTNLNDLMELKWKKIYTTRQYIPRLQKVVSDETLNFTGFKNIGNCDNTYSLPYNRINSNFNPLYIAISLVIRVIATIMTIINKIPLVKDQKLSCDGVELSPDDWKDCTLQNLANYFNVITYEFYNDWLTGSLYAPPFGYKVKFKNGKVKKERYCDFDCREKVNTPNNAPTYKNRCRNLKVYDKSEFFNYNNNPIRSVDRGVVVKNDNYYYYVARFDVERNTSTEVNLFPNQKDNLCFATQVVELGSMTECDIDNYPFIIKALQPTTYNENEEGDILYNIESLIPANFNRNAVQLISQINSEQISKFYDYEGVGNYSNYPEYDTKTNNKTDPVGFDRDNIILRKYLCETFKFYNSNFQHISYINNGSQPFYFVEDNEDGTTTVFDLTWDICKDCDDNNEPTKRIHPYYMYFGSQKGKNGFDKVIKNYFLDCE